MGYSNPCLGAPRAVRAWSLSDREMADAMRVVWLELRTAVLSIAAPGSMLQPRCVMR